MMSIVAKRLKEARNRKGLSQERLGILAGLDEASSSARMNQYERGKHTPDLQMVKNIAKVLDMPSAYFYAEDDRLAAIIMMFHAFSENDKSELLKIAYVFYGKE